MLRRLKVPAELHLFDGYRTNWTVCADEFMRQMNFDGRLGKEVKLMDRYNENSSRRRSEREDVWPEGKTPPGTGSYTYLDRIWEFLGEKGFVAQ